MKNKRGQALVEFIMILPILILLIMGIYDYGNILYNKSEMQSDLDEIIIMYQNEDSISINNYLSKKNLNINYNNEANFLTITVSKKINITTPVLSSILNSPYNLEVSRTIYVE